LATAGTVRLRVTLPQDLDANSVTAAVNNGILKVELTPVKPLSPKKIAVTSA